MMQMACAWTLQLRERVAGAWRFLNTTEGTFRERVFRSGAWVVASSFGARGIEFTRSIILARLLMPEVFGLMGIASFIINGLDSVTQTGTGAALIHRQEQAKEVYDTAWVIGLARGLVLAGAVALAAPYVADFYHRPVLDGVLKLVAVGLIVRGGSNINLILYRRDLDFKRLAIVEQVGTAVGAAIVVALAWWLRSIWALIIGNLITSVCQVAFSYIIQPEWPRLRFRLKTAKELYRYGRFVAWAGVVIFLTLEADNAIVGKLLGMEALGFYVLAYSLANLPATHITYVISNVMLPSYSKLQGEPERLREVYLKVLKVTSTLTLPTAAGLAFLAPDFVRVVYGPKWLPMVAALQLLCIHGAFRSVAAVNGPLYMAMGKPSYGFYLNAVRLVFMLAFIFPFAYWRGIEGVSIAVTIPLAGMLIASTVLACRLLHIRTAAITRRLRAPVLASLLMAGALLAITSLWPAEVGLAGLLARVGLGVVIYAGCLLALDRDSLGALRGLRQSA
jgi:O-antigen/teichoic acid export membrane protein